MDPTLKSKVISMLKAEYAEYSPRLKHVAKYILDNPAAFGLDPIRETARKSKVSTYTLVRLANRLGFGSFEELREPFRHALVSSTQFVDRPDWIDALSAHSDAGRVQAEASMNTLAGVETALSRLSPEAMATVIDLMLSARTVYLTAVRSSYSLAYYFHYVGRMALPSLQLIPRHLNSPLDELNTAGPQDVLIAITFNPYSVETIQACKFARKKGVRLILITDSDVVSPDLDPEVVLVASTISTHFFACFAGAMAIIENIIALLVNRGGEKAVERIESYERLRDEFNAYWRAPNKKH